MSDILSNALVRGLKHPESDVAAFLKNASNKGLSSAELLKHAAAHFHGTEAALKAHVEEYSHCNCKHAPQVEGQRTALTEAHDEAQRGVIEVSQFAKDTTLHVILHEIGHALMREFDLPVLGNEETAADAFATYFLATYYPERALDVLKARTASLMFEANEVPRELWSYGGEHNNDARRAAQIAALAIAVDFAKFDSVAVGVELSDREIQKAKDYGTEILRSWRRVLQPLWMPEGVLSREARVIWDPQDETIRLLCADGFADDLASIIKRFDWHSQITLHFVAGDGGAGWNRSKRTISVHSDYVQRFVNQGQALNAKPPTTPN